MASTNIEILYLLAVNLTATLVANQYRRQVIFSRSC